ncbi:MAG: DMT family transporter [Ancalomicrobiaceae bacterium]|nr:DMT family transporter [Ancalomicrobiaceae bacterium]
MPSHTHSARTMSAADWGTLLAVSVVWGGSFFFIRVALVDLPTLTIVTARVGLAALILHGVLRLTGRRFPTDRPTLTAFLVMGILNNVLPFTLIVWGETRIGAGLAAILNAMTPLTTAVIAQFLTPDERLNPGKIAGILTGFLGVAVMIGETALDGLSADLVAELACLAATVCYGFSGIYGRRFGRMRLDPVVTAAGQLTASSLVLAPLALCFDQPWQLPMPGMAAIGAVIGIAVLSTAFAYILYFRLLASAGATNSALITLLVPVSAILLGALVLGERLEVRHFLGMALIGAGLALIDGRLVRRLLASIARLSSR